MERAVAGRGTRAAGPAWLSAVVAASALGACGIPGLGGTGTAHPLPVRCEGTAGQQVLELVNGIRERHGLLGFVANARLIQAAARHSRDQAAGAPMGHVGTDGSTPGERVESAGYRWMVVSENVAAGYPTAGTVVAAWMDSPPHRATILSPKPVHAGVGYVFDSTRALRHFWTLDVAAPKGDADEAELPCHP